MTAIIQNNSEESTTTTVSQNAKNSDTSVDGSFHPDETSYSPSDVNRSVTSNAATSTSQDSGTTTLLTNTSGRSINTASSGKHLRKFASENSFMLGKNALQSVHVVSDKDSKNNEMKEDNCEFGTVHEISTKNRIFTVRPVTSLPGGAKRSCGSGTTPGKVSSKMQESEDGSGSLASEATVTSGAGVYNSATTTSKQKLRFKIRRPKSVSNMGNSISNNNYDTSYTSQTLHSMEGFDKLQNNGFLNSNEEQRRMSTVYMMDDDSTHEFEENQTG